MVGVPANHPSTSITTTPYNAVEKKISKTIPRNKQLMNKHVFSLVVWRGRQPRTFNP